MVLGFQTSSIYCPEIRENWQASALLLEFMTVGSSLMLVDPSGSFSPKTLIYDHLSN